MIESVRSCGIFYMPIKIYTISDLHVDYSGNLDHVLAFNDPNYADSALIFAGDASDNIDTLSMTLKHFTHIFKYVFFVPGNHELWVRDRRHAHSIEKFEAVIDLCHVLGVHTYPVKLGKEDDGVWIVPLFSWYTKPEEGNDSLYVPKPGDDQTELIWSDNHFCDWRPLEGRLTPTQYFLSLNETRVNRSYDAPVITFSHFLPRCEVAYALDENYDDPLPEFNFTRVAGTNKLLDQINTIGSMLHIYGHQHRNRHRRLAGVTYISHCLGYPREREVESWHGNDYPKLIWDDGELLIEQAY